MNKALLKNVAAVSAGVIIAGLILYQFQSNAFIADARKGFGG